MQTYGANAWRIHNYRLESAATSLEKAVEEMKELTVEVNRQRKNSQVRTISILYPYCLTRRYFRSGSENN
jgi:hypothetical protein